MHNTEDTNNKFPVRINAYLAGKKIASRREADLLIRKGRVLINGKTAVLGDRVERNDKVEVRKSANLKKTYIAYYKPRGEVTGERNFGDGLFPVGRLDKDSEGLMIITNDGRITDGMLNPQREHEKEYIVTVTDRLRQNFREKMEKGVRIENYTTRHCKVDVLGENKFRVVLTEGKKHQIRRMCAALHNRVKHLKRVRIMNIKLSGLEPGEYRNLENDELREFLAEAGL